MTLKSAAPCVKVTSRSSTAAPTRERIPRGEEIARGLMIVAVARMSKAISGNEREEDPDVASLIRATLSLSRSMPALGFLHGIDLFGTGAALRSEERRVGKECRS